MSGEPDDPDAAIADLARQVETAEEPDALVHHALAWAHQIRWDEGRDLQDLDRAIEHWRAALAVVPDPGGMAECGRLLAHRAEQDATEAKRRDVDEAVALLDRAAGAGQDCWWMLGLAYLVRRRIGGDHEDLTRAATCLDRGLADPPSPEWLVYAYQERLTLTKELLDAETAAETSAPPPSATEMLRQVDAARAVFDSGVGEHDDRARLAVSMATNAALAWMVHVDRTDGDWLAEMVAFGRTLHDKPPHYDDMLDTVAALGRYMKRATSGGGTPGDGLEELLRPMRAGTSDPALLASLEQITPMFLAAKAIQSGDRRLLRTAITRMRDSEDHESHLLGDVFEMIDRAQQGDRSVHQEIRAMLERLQAMPLSYGARESLTPMLTLIESIFSGADGRYRPVDRTPIAPGDLAAAILAVQALPAALLAATTRHDVETLRECGDRVDELLAELPAGHLIRMIALAFGSIGGVALLRDEPGDQRAARQVVRWTGEGLALAEGSHHPHWSPFALARAEALRHLDAGDRAESRRWGLTGLHGIAWQVLLQSGTDDAVLVAAEAGETARRVAGWCHEDKAMDDLVAAVDAGRGLVLQAATASRTIAERLDEAGRPDLAERWRASAGYGRDQLTGVSLRATAGTVLEVPDDLRSDVLRLLELSAPEPASADEIRTALTAAEADALVYLLPMRIDQPGTAVIVPALGAITTLVLPGLRTDPRSVFASHTGALRGTTRDAGPVDDPGEEARGPDALCRWAWSAAMGALLRHCDAWELGRPARLVLVPTGPLAAVPWHAAFTRAGERRRYAVESAVISYAVSGRAFAQGAREPVREVRSALVVGDPTGDLPFAGVEARAIVRAFHPEGAYLGRADGSGTPQQVLDWIAAAAPGPSMLHLACHGRAYPSRPADACLLLYGGELTARRLLEASRTAELEIERVFLAACATGVIGLDHDEAFSLATAFLSAGAHTVFGSLWRVPDEETSVLMFLVHHYLNVDGCGPAEALHRAQLWMLDPGRIAPPEMPPELRRHCASPGLADPVAWAGFTHQGR